jgi:hypothetical protein
VTDAGVKELPAFTKLSILDLDSTQVTDAGMKELAAIKNLNDLNLYHSRVAGSTRTARGVSQGASPCHGQISLLLPLFCSRSERGWLAGPMRRSLRAA